MKNRVSLITGMIVLNASMAYAGPFDADAGMSLLGYLFLGFFALVIVSQLVPACLLFYGMVKGVFSGWREKTGASKQ